MAKVEKAENQRNSGEKTVTQLCKQLTKTDKTSSTVKKKRGEGTKLGKYKGKRLKIKEHKLKIKERVNEHVDIEDQKHLRDIKFKLELP